MFALLAPLKRKGDPAITENKAGLIAMLVEWEGRTEVVMEAPSSYSSQAMVSSDISVDFNSSELDDRLLIEESI